MSFRERWTKKFAGSITKDDGKAFRLWLDFSKGKIFEPELKAKMNNKASNTKVKR